MDLISGKPRQGKSLWAMAWIASLFEDLMTEEFFKAYPNGIWTDIILKGELGVAKPQRLIGSYADLLEARDCIVVLDEAQLYLNSRGYKQLPMEVQFFLQQHGKRNIHLIFISQNARRMEVVARELLVRYYEVSRGDWWYLRRLVTVKEYDPDTIAWASDGKPTSEEQKEERVVKRRWVWLPGWPKEEPVHPPTSWQTFWKPLFGQPSPIGVAWSSYDTRQEVLMPTDSLIKGSDTMGTLERGRGGFAAAPLPKKYEPTEPLPFD